MGAAGKKREEELLAKIEALRKDIGYRDTSIAQHLATIEDQNQKINQLNDEILALKKAIEDLNSKIQDMQAQLDKAHESGDEATNALRQ